jgi:hypothetical protein
MLVRLEFLHGTEGLRDLLQANGWVLGGPGAGPLLASHPEAIDQPSARSRLHGLGLLTSGRLRIQFGPYSDPTLG